MYYYTSNWLFYITRHLIDLESHVTRRTKRRVSWEIKIVPHLLTNLGTFHSKGIQSQYEHMTLINMIKSKLYNLTLNYFYATKSNFTTTLNLWFGIIKNVLHECLTKPSGNMIFSWGNRSSYFPHHHVMNVKCIISLRLLLLHISLYKYFTRCLSKSVIKVKQIYRNKIPNSANGLFVKFNIVDS